MADDIDDTTKGKTDCGCNPSTGTGPTLVRTPDPDHIIDDMRRYWENLRRGRAVPDRTDVEPKGMLSILDYAFIVERIAPGAARFRLAGRHLLDLMGMEVRGMPACSFFNPHSRGRLCELVETVFKAPQIIDLTLISGPEISRPALPARILFMPLKSDLGDVTRALGCLVSSGQIGRSPRRFDISNDLIIPVIGSAKPILPDFLGFGELYEPSAAWRSGVTSPLQEQKIQPNPRHSPEERRARFRVITSESCQKEKADHKNKERS